MKLTSLLLFLLAPLLLGSCSSKPVVPASVSDAHAAFTKGLSLP